MVNLNDNIMSLIHKEEDKHVIKNAVLDDKDIMCLLENKRLPHLSNSNILLKFCTIEIRDLSWSDIKNFIELFTPVKCKLYIPKRINKYFTLSLTLGLNNELFKGTVIDNILSNGLSLSSINDDDISKISLKNIDLRNMRLPKNRNFFQLVKNKKVEKVKLPLINFREYDISGVEFKNCIFHNESTIPNDFFQKIKNKTLIGAILPPINFEKTNIKDSSFCFVNFGKGSKFPKDKDFFKEFNYLYGCKFIKYDYSVYDFDDVNLNYCIFPEGSILPYSKKLADCLMNNKYPKEYINNIHLMPLCDLDCEDIIEKYKKQLTVMQTLIIKLKNNSTNRH